MTEIRVPTLGESVTEATIGRWFKKAGDEVKVDGQSRRKKNRTNIDSSVPSRPAQLS